MQKITYKEIDFTRSYFGYLWYSDGKKPRIFSPEELSDVYFTDMPFILEGYLYSPEEGGICINIKNIGGEYLIHQVRLNEIEKSKIERYSFLTSPVFETIGIKKFKAIQYWSSEKDEYCENMEVLQPSWIAFEGFEHKNN